MSRHRPLRGIKICPHCGGGYDAFKPMEARGRYCSPGCLAEARLARRGAADVDPGILSGSGAALPVG